ncbi:MAG: hypothetical protein UY28_C0004G0017 [Candidatus Amesbacteria bacterium GW2011_GWB1_48_13]|uniref:Uncharacterized protein n=1 Tax=Candidatus Amesbacteria bacterium GW2011_GWB1_48_13 TaxID=1618362 RepID=A0A0G1UVJ4_9BACT|nr:MAG: hypothetical protein UY28_C0004G0017 [Candidatus Amesbacteria bacterium GW2011_GWB1_48_13]
MRTIDKLKADLRGVETTGAAGIVISTKNLALLVEYFEANEVLDGPPLKNWRSVIDRLNQARARLEEKDG